MATQAHRLERIDDLVDQLFARKWVPFEDATSDNALRDVGVYALAFSHRALTGKRPKANDVFYVGMSLSLGGVRGRLKQFRDAIERGYGHSGGDRFFRDYAGGKAFSKWNTRKRFFVAALTIPCGRETPADLRQRGHVACLEHYVVARVLELTGKRPLLNKL